jgi:hypothetical protein
MPRRILDRIRAAIRNGTYDMTGHAVDEMAEDGLDLVDVEAAILKGRLIKTEKDDPRGTRYTVQGTGADEMTPVGTVGRFTETRRYLIITVYKMTEP